MFSIGDLVDKLVIENMKIFSLRDRLKSMECESPEKKNTRVYVETYQKMMQLIDNRATICNSLDEKVDKVCAREERNYFLKKIRTYNDEI